MEGQVRGLKGSKKSPNVKKERRGGNADFGLE